MLMSGEQGSQCLTQNFNIMIIELWKARAPRSFDGHRLPD